MGRAMGTVHAAIIGSRAAVRAAEAGAVAGGGESNQVTTGSREELTRDCRHWYTRGYEANPDSDVLPAEYYRAGSAELLAYWTGREDAAAGRSHRASLDEASPSSGKFSRSRR